VAFLPRLFSKRIVGFNFWSKFLRDGVQDFPGLLGRVLFRLRLWSVDGSYSLPPRSIDVEAILFHSVMQCRVQRR
jgi:hypothetical protein